MRIPSVLGDPGCVLQCSLLLLLTTSGLAACVIYALGPPSLPVALTLLVNLNLNGEIQLEVSTATVTHSLTGLCSLKLSLAGPLVM